MKVKVLGICTSPVKDGNVENLLKVTLDVAQGEKDVETELVTLRGKKIGDCIQCNWCLRKQEEGRYCNQDDDMQELYPKIIEADVVIMGTPVYIMRATPVAYAVFDRLRCLGEGKYYRHEPILADKVGGVVAVAYMRHCGVETCMISLQWSMELFNFVLASGGLGSPYGVGGLSSKTGAGGFDLSDKLTAAHEDFAVRSATVLGKRAVCLAKMIKAGKQALPKEEWYSWWPAYKQEYDRNLPFK